MNQIQLIFIRLSFLLLLIIPSSNTFGQYLEEFPIPEKGILLGPCPGGTSASCASIDFIGVNWLINGNFTGFDAVSGAEDYLKTISGAFEFGGDVDEELCWESPMLDIDIGSNVSFSLDLVWNSQDGADYIDVEYQIDGGAWIQISNQFGGGSHTIDYTTSGNSGSGTISQVGLSGNTLSIRVCVDTNTSSELTRLDNVDVPEVGVTVAGVLPVELTSFNVEKLKESVKLSWSTATETNNDRFEIEHYFNEKGFEKIGEIGGNGTTLSPSHYSFLHDQSTVGQHYYRLKQIDFDGRFEYSNIMSVNFQPGELNISEFYPNPSKNGLVNLDFFASDDSSVEVVVYDLSGQQVFQQKYSVVEGQNQLSFNFATVKNGLYWVKIGNDMTTVYRKLMIQ